MLVLFCCVGGENSVIQGILILILIWSGVLFVGWMAGTVLETNSIVHRLESRLRDFPESKEDEE